MCAGATSELHTTANTWHCDRSQGMRMQLGISLKTTCITVVLTH